MIAKEDRPVRDPAVNARPHDGPPDLLELAEAMRSLAERSNVDDGRPALDHLVHTALERIPRATWVSMTILRGGSFRTEASTHASAVRADALQYEVGSGPCVDAVLDDSMYLTGDVRSDERWSEWGRRVHAELGLNSVLAQRLGLLDESGAIAALNVYSDVPDAFDAEAVAMGLVLSTHASLLVTSMLARDRASNLLRALESNREIGVAMGILMQRHHLTREQAFDVLRVASQDSNRKLVDIAAEVADTGILALKRWPATAPAQAPAV